MIKMQDAVPEVYYNMSRDFQLVGRLYDVVLNSVKTNIDLIKSVPNSDNLSTTFLDLLAKTLGFKSKHSYNAEQLTALSRVFSEIVRNKGNITSILQAGHTLLNAEGIAEEFICYVKDHTIELFISEKLSDINLLKDLLTYILPAGITSRIVRATQQSLSDGDILTEIAFNSKVTIYKVNNYNVSVILKASDVQTNIGTEGLSYSGAYPGHFINGEIIRPEIAKEFRFYPINSLTAQEVVRQPHQISLTGSDRLITNLYFEESVRQPHQMSLTENNRIITNVCTQEAVRQPHQMSLTPKTDLMNLVNDNATDDSVIIELENNNVSNQVTKVTEETTELDEYKYSDATKTSIVKTD